MDVKALTLEEEKEFTQLIYADIESGELERVISLFTYNKSLYSVVGNLIKNGDMKVRLGTVMLVEELAETKPEYVKLILPNLLPLLKDESATVRGDVADLVGTVGGIEQIDDLKPLLNDPVRPVVEMAEEAIEIIRGRCK